MTLSAPLITGQEMHSSGTRRGALVTVAVSALLGALFAITVVVVVGSHPGLATVGLAASVATASDADVVGKSFAAWGAGDFVGSRARAAVAEFYNEDAVFDFSANIDEPLFKVYYGQDGITDLCQNLLALKFLHFTPTVFMGPDGTVIARSSYGSILLSTNKESRYHVDFFEFRMKGGRISHAKIFWGNQKQMNKQWASETITPVQNMLAAWGAGELTGPDASGVTSKFFTSDVVFDATAEVAGTDMYKVYYGTDGVQAWTQFLTAFQFKDFTPSFFAGPTRDIVMAQLSYGLTYKPTGKSAPLGDMFMVRVVDGKISYAKIFWGAPSAIERVMSSN